MTTLPTRPEFAERRRQFAAGLRRLITVGAIVGLGGVVLGIGLMAANPRKQKGGWLGYVGVAVMLSSVPAAAVYLDRGRQRLAREAGLGCPACGKPLVDLNAKLALTTGRCAECGQRVVRDDEAPTGVD